jgi:hypothetical protein
VGGGGGEGGGGALPTHSFFSAGLALRAFPPPRNGRDGHGTSCLRLPQLQATAMSAPEPTTAPPMTTKEMASEIGAELGIEATPLTELVERAAAMIGMDFGEEEVPLIERLRAVHEEVCCSWAIALANTPLDDLNADAEALAPFDPPTR